MISWHIGVLDRILVALWSIPFYTNRWPDYLKNTAAVGMMTTQDIGSRYNSMYNGEEKGFSREEFYNSNRGQSVVFSDENFTVIATFDSGWFFLFLTNT